MKSLRLFILSFITLLLSLANLDSAEYIAYSLKVAQERLKLSQGEPFNPELVSLGGITRLAGLIYDQKDGDIILIGQASQERQPLTLDDLVSALKARFVYGVWPLVSIEPAEDTENDQLLICRFEGGIRDTALGLNMFDADYILKQIGMGLLESGLPNLNTYWDMVADEAKQSRARDYKVNFSIWLYPVLSCVMIKDDVALMNRTEICIFTDVMSLEIDDRKINEPYILDDLRESPFTRDIKIRFDEFARLHPAFLRLQRLLELAGVARGIEGINPRPDLSYWLVEYQPKKVVTPRDVKPLKRQKTLSGLIGEGAVQCRCELSGGVQLTAITLDLKEKEANALKETALEARHGKDQLSWRFVFDSPTIPDAAADALSEKDVALLFSRALLLEEMKRYEDAINIYDKIIALEPGLDWPYYNRGRLYDKLKDALLKALDGLARGSPDRGILNDKLKGKYKQAIADYTKAIEINPGDAYAYHKRGIAYASRNDFSHAEADFSRALELNPWLVGAYNNRGFLYDYSGEYDKSIADYTQALKINPNYAQAYYNRALAYDYKGNLDQSIADYKKAVEINPRFVNAYFNMAAVCEKAGRIKEAIEAYKGFIQYVSTEDIYYKMFATERIEKLEEEIKEYRLLQNE